MKKPQLIMRPRSTGKSALAKAVRDAALEQGADVFVAAACPKCNGHGRVLSMPPTHPQPGIAADSPAPSGTWITCPHCVGTGRGIKQIAVRKETVG